MHGRRRDERVRRNLRVRCPVCQRVYQLMVSLAWWREASRKTQGLPECECVPCLRAEDAARRYGGAARDWLNGECAPQ